MFRVTQKISSILPIIILLFFTPTKPQTCQVSSDCLTPTRPLCSSGTCIPCTSNQNCQTLNSATPICSPSTGSCLPCVTSSECSEALPICVAAAGLCVRCSSNIECQARDLNRPVCSASGTCLGCSSNDQCPPQYSCETLSGRCFQDLITISSFSPPPINSDSSDLTNLPTSSEIQTGILYIIPIENDRVYLAAILVLIAVLIVLIGTVLVLGYLRPKRTPQTNQTPNYPVQAPTTPTPYLGNPSPRPLAPISDITPTVDKPPRTLVNSRKNNESVTGSGYSTRSFTRTGATDMVSRSNITGSGSSEGSYTQSSSRHLDEKGNR